MDEVIINDSHLEQILRQMPAVPEQAADGIVVTDLAGTLRFVNPAWAVMHGYETVDQLLGKHISTFHTADEMKNLVEGFMEEVKNRGQLAGPIQHVRKDGTVFHSQTKMTAAADREGRLLGFVVCTADNTNHDPLQKLSRDRLIEPAEVDLEFQKGRIECKRTEDSFRQQIDQLTENGRRLESQIVEYAGERNKLKERCLQLEKHLEAKSAELAVALEQLENGTAQYRLTERQLRQQVDELFAANKQLEDRALQHEEQQQSLKHRSDELVTANQELRQQIAEYVELKDKLTQHNDQLQCRIEQQAAEMALATKQFEQVLAKHVADSEIHVREVIDGIEEQRKAEIADIESKAQQAIARERAAAAEVTEALERLKAHVEEEKTENAARVAAITAEADEKIARLNKELETKARHAVAEIKADYEETIFHMTAKIEDTANAKTRLEEQLAQHQDEVTKIRMQAKKEKEHYEELIIRSRSDADAKAKVWDDRMSQLESQLTEKEVQFSEKIANFNAQVKETIAKERMRANEADMKAARAEETIARIMSEARAKEEGYRSTIEKLEAEATEKEQLHAKDIAAVRTEADEALATSNTQAEENIRNIRAGYEERIDKITSENRAAVSRAEALARKKEEDLKNELKLEAEEQQRLHSEQIENIRTNLEKEIQGYEQANVAAQQQITELILANERLESQVSTLEQAKSTWEEDSKKLQKHIAQQMEDLAAANKQLQEETARRKQAEEDLAQLNAKLNNINAIARKYL